MDFPSGICLLVGVHLDIATLFAVTVFTMGLSGLLLLFAWLQARGTMALAWWGSAFLLYAPACALLGSRGLVSNFWSMQVATAAMLLGYGMMWTGARVFEGRRPLPLWIIAGPLIWIAAFEFDVFVQRLEIRVVLASGLVAAYSLAFISELWRGRRDRLVSRWPVMAIVGLHAALFPVRVPYLMSIQFPLRMPQADTEAIGLVIFTPLLYAFALTFLLMALTKERAESDQRHAATIDPLTGIPNRRGFTERAERLISRARRDRAPLTLLLFDLDRFKTINDRFGHLTGDAVLVTFTRSAAQSLRPLDLLGRIGGEEFVAILPDVSIETAVTIAERVRHNFEAAAAAIRGWPVAATVSVGIAASSEAGHDFDRLYAIADDALYCAKQKGRNRVEAGRTVQDIPPRRVGLVTAGVTPG